MKQHISYLRKGDLAFELNYTLVKDSVCIDGKKVNTYGIRIDKTDSQGFVNATSYVSSLSSDAGVAEHFFNCVVKGSVTPETLYDVAEDFVS